MPSRCVFRRESPPSAGIEADRHLMRDPDAILILPAREHPARGRSPDPLAVRRWLWRAGGGMAILVLAVVAAEVVASVRHPSPTLTLGYDLLPGYVAGTLVREGRYRDLYNPAAVEATERRVMA